jgi:hypothetical protein
LVKSGPATISKLDRLRGTYGELRATLHRLGDGKALSRLLNIQADFRWNIVGNFAKTPLREEVNTCHGRNHDDCAQREPAP